MTLDWRTWLILGDTAFIVAYAVWMVLIPAFSWVLGKAKGGANALFTKLAQATASEARKAAAELNQVAGPAPLPTPAPLPATPIAAPAAPPAA